MPSSYDWMSWDVTNDVKDFVEGIDNITLTIEDDDGEKISKSKKNYKISK